MEKLKQTIRNLSFIKSFVIYAVSSILLSILLTEFETTIFHNAQKNLAFHYSEIVEGYNSTKVWGDSSIFLLTPDDSRRMQVYEFFLRLLPPATYLLCILLTAWLFFRHKLKTPLSLLTQSASQIKQNQLDFTLLYDRDDEMGSLCKAFEQMRSSLESNYQEMWRQMDDRKRLNAAFSHDLRTPLTVLEGHLDILQKFSPETSDPSGNHLSPEEVADTYRIMEQQVIRLKRYVTSMNELQRLEDLPIHPQEMPVAELLATLKDTADIICNSKQLTFTHQSDTSTVTLDATVILQIFENLLSNALRYADTSITVECTVLSHLFTLKVSDDGPGFSPEAIRSATDPFFTTESKADSVHFGLGLNICHILCLRHQGRIVLNNQTSGGACITITLPN